MTTPAADGQELRQVGAQEPRLVQEGYCRTCNLDRRSCTADRAQARAAAAEGLAVEYIA